MANHHPDVQSFVKEAISLYEPAELLDHLLKQLPKMEKQIIDSPEAAMPYIYRHLNGEGVRKYEVFGMTLLDNRHHVLESSILFEGTIDGCSVHPRRIVELTLETGAAAVILWHNHPSDNCEPSAADEAITRRIRDALKLIDVRLLDHFIVGRTTYVSLAERGII